MKRKGVSVFILLALLFEMACPSVKVWANYTNNEGVTDWVIDATEVSAELKWEGTDNPGGYEAIYQLFEEKESLNIIEINTIEDFIYFIEGKNDDVHTGSDYKVYDGKKIYLNNDLDFSEYELGYNYNEVYLTTHPFGGKFYGQGHEIKNFGSSFAIFNKVENAEIRDLIITRTETSTLSDVYGHDYQGGIANIAKNSKFVNCRVNGNADIRGSKIKAGIVGQAEDCKIINCVNNNNFMCSITELDRTYGIPVSGGIVGVAVDSKIYNCENLGKFYVNNCVKDDKYEFRLDDYGGIVGKVQTSTIYNCKNSGDIEIGTSTDRNKQVSKVGGIVGFGDEINLLNCENRGNISIVTDKMDMVGGIIGRLDSNSTIDKCANYGNVSCDSMREAWYAYGNVMGGIAGFIGHNKITVRNCISLGNLYTCDSNEFHYMYAGGIIGRAYHLQEDDEFSNIENCYFRGHYEDSAWTEEDKYSMECRLIGSVGWIGGPLEGKKIKIKNCYNAATPQDDYKICILGEKSTCAEVIQSYSYQTDEEQNYWDMKDNNGIRDDESVIITSVQELLSTLNSNMTDEDIEKGYCYWIKDEDEFPTLDYKTGIKYQIDDSDTEMVTRDKDDEPVESKITEIEASKLYNGYSTYKKYVRLNAKDGVTFDKLPKRKYRIKEIAFRRWDSEKRDWIELELNKDYKVEVNGNTITYTILKEEPQSKKGDLTGEGIIDINDIIALKRHIAAQETGINKDKWLLSKEKQTIADVTGDGVIDGNDILKLQRYIAANEDEKVAQKHPTWLQL